MHVSLFKHKTDKCIHTIRVIYYKERCEEKMMLTTEHRQFINETSSSVSHDANFFRKKFHVSLCTVAKCLCIGAVECNEFRSGLINKNCTSLEKESGSPRETKN